MHRNYDTVEENWKEHELHIAKNEAVALKSVREFRNLLAQNLKVHSEQLNFFPSGRVALEFLLSSLDRSQKKDVLVPAFNCSVVEQSIKNTGLNPVCFDFSTVTGLFDWETIKDLINDNVVAIIITHFFGVPVDFTPLIEICHQRSIAIIEDCAHCLGGLIGDQTTGTIGDAAIFSFNYDKPISLGWGGSALINNTQIFSKFSSPETKEPTAQEEWLYLLKFLRWTKVRRQLIRTQSGRLKYLYKPVLKSLGLDSFSLPKLSLGPIRAELGSRCLGEYQTTRSDRNTNAKFLASQLHALSWPVGTSVTPAWIKQKVKFENVTDLKFVSRKLQRHGYRCGNYNWPSVLPTAITSANPQSYDAAKLWMDIPIHQNLSLKNISEIIAILNENMERHS